MLCKYNIVWYVKICLCILKRLSFTDVVIVTEVLNSWYTDLLFIGDWASDTLQCGPECKWWYYYSFEIIRYHCLFTFILRQMPNSIQCSNVWTITFLFRLFIWIENINFSDNKINFALLVFDDLFVPQDNLIQT